MIVAKLYRWLQLLSVNLLLGAGVVFTLMVGKSFIPEESPAMIKEQRVRVVTVSNTHIVLESNTTLIVRSSYDAMINWYMRCSPEEFFDMGHKRQVRNVGVYIQKNTMVIPSTMFNKDCEYHTTFTWTPHFALWPHTVERDIIFLHLTDKGELRYRREPVK